MASRRLVLHCHGFPKKTSNVVGLVETEDGIKSDEVDILFFFFNLMILDDIGTIGHERMQERGEGGIGL